MGQVFGMQAHTFAREQHQERVNQEMFKAIELLGRKLERVEGERDRLQRRLALIESAASVDEKTGKLYLPVAVHPEQLPVPAVAAAAPRWVTISSVMSSALALFAVSLVLLRDPAPQQLTARQLAALSALSSMPQPSLARIETSGWKSVETLAEDETPASVKTLAAVSDAVPEARAVEEEASAATVQIDTQEDQQDATKAEVADVTQALRDKLAEKEALQKKIAEDLASAEKRAQEAKQESESLKTAQAEAAVQSATAKTAAASVQDIPPPPRAATVTGIARDPSLSPKLAELEKRAFADVAEAQHDLATLYASGKVVQQDYKRAAYWFKRAADGGVANALYNLGVMSQQGLGVPVNVAAAIDWYEKAAELGHPEAMYNLGIAYIEGVGVERNTDRGISFFRRAANAGVAQAAYNLGILYESNFVGSIDLAKAHDWYQTAAELGHADATTAMARVDTAMDDDHALLAADMIEPAAGDEEGAFGQGDASLPGDERPAAPENIVKKVQIELGRKGLLSGSATGAMDARTEDAIRSWQQRHGLKIDGLASDSLLEKMQKTVD